MFNFTFIKKIKNKIFPFYKNRELKLVFKTLQEGHPKETKVAMFVGGCVRKYLTNEKINDIDIATALTIDSLKQKFKDTNFKIIDTGVEHGSVTLITNDLKLEITTLRKDVKTDGRHAEIEYTENWQEDSNRRDFTFNAIYLDINGKIFDPQSGVLDLKNRIVKFIGDPNKRIEEDFLRILRFIRFSLEYSSAIDKSTLKAVKFNLDGIKKISKERIYSELLKILSLKNFLIIHENQSIKEVFAIIFPELKYLKRLIRIHEVSKALPLDKNILLAILLIDEKNNHEYFLHKYNVSNVLKKELNFLHDNYQIFKKDRKYFHGNLKKNIFYIGKENLQKINLINFSCNDKIKIKDYLNVFNLIKKTSVPKFPYDGNYLKNKGLIEGLKIGSILELIKQEWVKNDFKISENKVEKIIKDNSH